MIKHFLLVALLLLPTAFAQETLEGQAHQNSTTFIQSDYLGKEFVLFFSDVKLARWHLDGSAYHIDDQYKDLAEAFIVNYAIFNSSFDRIDSGIIMNDTFPIYIDIDQDGKEDVALSVSHFLNNTIHFKMMEIKETHWVRSILIGLVGFSIFLIILLTIQSLFNRGKRKYNEKA